MPHNSNHVIRIAVADDELSVCELFSNYVNTIDKCKVVIQAGDGTELLAALKQTPDIDLAILDVMMPLLGGYDTAMHIRETYPAIKILFYTSCKNDLALHLMAINGGHGLIQKGLGAGEAAKAIQTVMAGEYYFPAMGERIRMAKNRQEREAIVPVKTITKQEVGFIRLCASEMAYKAIADYLVLGTRQLEHLRETVFKKMSVKSRVALVIKGYESGLLTLARPIPVLQGHIHKKTA